MDLSPQLANYCTHSTDMRIKKRKRWDDKGVAATVGTIMSLMVFLTFMGLFTNQILPVWMSDNESTHMSEVIGQFANLKSSIDVSISNYANSLVAPTPLFVPLTLGSAGIPVFAAPTAGVLILNPGGISSRPSFNVTYQYQTPGKPAGSLNSSNDGGSGGLLKLYCPNRYYVEETIIYENGAIILNQSDGEFIVAGPQFLVKNVGTVTSPHIVVMLTQINILGNNKTVGGTGSKGVNANLQFANSQEYVNDVNPAGSTLTFTIVTQHGVAWQNFFNASLNKITGMAYGSTYTISSVLKTFQNPSQNYYIVTVSISHVFVFDHTRADVSIDIGELVMP